MTTRAPETGAAPTRAPRTVLVANRGEIALRVIRTVHRLGMRAVAVHTADDADAPHVGAADVAMLLGGPDAPSDYLDVAAVVDAARRAGADAVHPGYGFLSENPALARACEAAGVVFVGPSAEAIEVMGDKIRAKRHVAAAGVPVVRGVDEPGLDDDALVAAAADLGYPLLVKPSAGGGGKGMAVVSDPADLRDALSSARRLARTAFDDDALLLEELVPRPRHIEVQVMADAHGSVIHLGERECSLQRRHQKVVEEAPSSVLDEETRRRIGEAACEVARSVAYRGAGTVEFLVPAEDPTTFAFIEMNTRLQVEHPVTEMVTGLDLVELQLRVAAGEPLPLTQDDVVLHGHAVEARIYAEDAGRGFLPATGTIHGLREPSGDGVRVDAGWALGMEVGTRFDPMLAKVIAWGPDRLTALDRLDRALAGTAVLGVTTSVEVLRAVLAAREVRDGDLDTSLLGRLLDGLVPAHVPAVPDPHVLAAAALALEDPPSHQPARDPRLAGSAWAADGWRVGEHSPVRRELVTADGTTRDIALSTGPGERTLTVDRDEHTVRLIARRPVPGTGTDDLTVSVDGTTRTFVVTVATAGTSGDPSATAGLTVHVADDGATHALRVRTRTDRLAEVLAARGEDAGTGHPEVRAPMPGTVVAVHVSPDEHVTAGQALLAVEAMKMEHVLRATTDGAVTLGVREGDQVRLDQVVATITPHPHEGTPA